MPGSAPTLDAEPLAAAGRLTGPAQPSRRATSPFGGVLIAVVGVCLLIAGLEVWHTWESRTIAIATAEVETANLAGSLAQHTHDLIQSADLVLTGVRERVEGDGTSPQALQRLHRWLVTAIGTQPMIHGVFVYNAAGDWIANSELMSLPAHNNSDRDYFRYHRDHNDDRIYFGKPVESKANGAWIVTLSRRIDAPDGSFDGVALTSISIDQLRRFYATFDMGKSGAITLLSADGTVLAREPSGDGAPGMDLSRSQVFQDFLPHAPAGSFTAVYALDGVARLGSYRRLADYPLVIVVARGLDDVLRPWRSDARLHAGIGIVTILALAFVGIRFANQLRRTQVADRRYRLLADNATDVIACVGLTGRRLYLSPAFAALTGWSVRDGMRRPWLDLVDPDDRAGIRAFAAGVGGTGLAAHTFRYVRSDGAHRWAEVRVQRMGAAEGLEAQFIATFRDVTERRVAEDQVASLNRALAVQAVTDSLTGLGNRRRFDEGLEQEWRRAAREHRSLSLLIIDIDRFKLYNDHYGHQQGDRCLRTVAAAIAGCARRAGDIAARYGGEEFVLLLPGADAAAAARLGEGVRAAIEALGQDHAANPPAGVVTASVGVATLSPAPDDSGGRPDDLVAAADAALYGAKHAGRNRVVCGGKIPAAAAPAVALPG